MSKPLRILKILALSVLVAFALAFSVFAYKIKHLPTRSFSQFVRISKITVYNDAGVCIAVIRSPARIADICALANRYSDKWGGAGDVFGVPIAPLKAEFFAGQVFQGHLGIGDGFLETQRDGDFASRQVSKSETNALKTLLSTQAH